MVSLENVIFDYFFLGGGGGGGGRGEQTTKKLANYPDYNEFKRKQVSICLKWKLFWSQRLMNPLKTENTPPNFIHIWCVCVCVCVCGGGVIGGISPFKVRISSGQTSFNIRSAIKLFNRHV